MHGPTGSSGVQAFPHSAQSGGMMRPRSSSPHRQPFASFGAGGVTGNYLSAS